MLRSSDSLIRCGTSLHLGLRVATVGAMTLLTLWAVGAVVGSNFKEHTLDPTTGLVTRRPGSTEYFRREGWGVSRFGPRGTNFAVQRRLSPGAESVYVYGDSIVECSQVDDTEKLDYQLCDALAAAGYANVAAIGLGYSGQCVADYVHQIPILESAWGRPRCHVIVVVNVADFLPDRAGQLRSRFVSTGTGFEFRFHQPYDARMQSIYRLVNAMGLNVLQDVNLQIKELRRDGLRLSVGPLALSPSRGRPTRSMGGRGLAFDFANGALRSSTTTRLLVVYAPRVPRMAGSRLVEVNPERRLAEELAASAQRHGIEFVDLSPHFIELSRRDRKLPFGFVNGRPGSGHMNPDGLAVVASVIAHQLRRESGASLSD